MTFCAREILREAFETCVWILWICIQPTHLHMYPYSSSCIYTYGVHRVLQFPLWCVKVHVICLWSVHMFTPTFSGWSETLPVHILPNKTNTERAMWTVNRAHAPYCMLMLWSELIASWGCVLFCYHQMLFLLLIYLLSLLLAPPLPPLPPPSSS